MTGKVIDTQTVKSGAGAWEYETNDKYGHVLNKLWGRDCAGTAVCYVVVK